MPKRKMCLSSHGAATLVGFRIFYSERPGLTVETGPRSWPYLALMESLGLSGDMRRRQFKAASDKVV